MIGRSNRDSSFSNTSRMLFFTGLFALVSWGSLAEQSAFPWTENFETREYLDESQTTVRWCPVQQALTTAFQQDSWQSTNRTWQQSPLTTEVFNAKAVVTGDVNNDGLPDIVIGNHGQPNLLYLNLGGGQFYEGAMIGNEAENTSSIALGDINGNGALDIVVGNINGINKIYFNDGTGKFAASVNISETIYNTRSIALGDVNNDGHLDIILGNYGTTNRLYLNHGGGDFGTGEDITNASMDTLSVVLGDVNADGYPDLVTGNWAQPNRLYLNDTQGGFILGYDIAEDSDPTNVVALADVNNNGKLDIIAGNYGTENCVYFNQENNQWKRTVLSADTLLTTGLCTGDMDGDGLVDVITADDALNIHVYFGLGDGTFTRRSAIAEEAHVPSSVVVADFSTDGRLDILSGSFSDPPCLFINRGCSNPFRMAQRYPLNVSGENTTSLALHDIDGDGHADIVAGKMRQPNVIYLNNGRGDFLPAVAISNDSHATTSIAIGDVTEDGLPDIVAGNMQEENVLYINKGSMAWESMAISNDKLGTTSVALGDINGNGFLDVVVGNLGDVNQLFLNAGNGTFKMGMDIAKDTHDTFSVVLGDVNGDGRLDLVVGNYGAPNRLYLNSGGAYPFSDIEGMNISPDSHNTLSIALGDLNGDGLLDVVAGNFEGPDRYYLNAGGEILFEGPAGKNITEDLNRTFSISLGDLDGDGDLDIASGNAEQIDYIYLNNGTEEPFSRVLGIPLSTRPHHTLSQVIGTIDASGVPAIVTGFRTQGERVYKRMMQHRRDYGLDLSHAEFIAEPGSPHEYASLLPSGGVLVGERHVGNSETPPAPHFDFNKNIALSAGINAPEERVSALFVKYEANTPPNTAVSMYVTNDGGSTWIQAQSGRTIIFPEPGNQVRWKAIFHSLTSVHSAQLLKVLLDIPIFTVTFETDGTPGSALTGTKTQVVKAGQTTQPIAAITPEGYCFARWDADEGQDFGETLIVENVMKNITYTAFFTREIRTAEELMRIGIEPDYPLDGRYCLAQDITITDSVAFVPIGSVEQPFSGWFYGNNHNIYGLSMPHAKEPQKGFFRVIAEHAEVRDLNLLDVNITHHAPNAGVIAGTNNGLIHNCHVKGRFSYPHYTDVRGAIAGENGASGIIQQCTSMTEVRGMGNSIGGLVGINRGIIRDSSAEGSVDGTERVGGLVGFQDGGTLLRSWYDGTVSAVTGDVGSIVGTAVNTRLEHCLALGNVFSVSGDAGGLIGNAWQTELHLCLTMAGVTSNEGCAGGLAGMFNYGAASSCFVAGPLSGAITAGLFNFSEDKAPEMAHCYWNVESTGQNIPAPGNEELEGAMGKTTKESLSSQTFMNWDIDENSFITFLEGKTYPYLSIYKPHVTITSASSTGNNSAVFDVRFSLPVPAFAFEDIKLAYDGTQYTDYSLTPANDRHPTHWRIEVQVADPVGRVSASVNINDILVSDTALATVFSGAPKNPVVSEVQITSITWSWENNCTFEDGFLIYLSSPGNDLETAVTHLPADTNSHTARGLLPNREYTFSVSAIKGDYESSKTAPLSIWTLANTPFPPILTASTGDTITVTVDSNDNNPLDTEYALRISPAASGRAWVQSGGQIVRTPDWRTANDWTGTTITGLQGGTKYGVSVIARNNDHIETEPSPEATLHTRLSLLYSAGPNGEVSRTPSTIAYGDDGPVVTATPAPGYRFVHWSDGITENPRRDIGITRDISVTAVFSPLFSGKGTAGEPFEISDAVQLQAIVHFPDRHFALLNDIDASSTSSWNDGAGFVPLGDSKAPFTGTFSGAGHAITGLCINRPRSDDVGLFGVLGEGSRIENVQLRDARIKGNKNVGALAGSGKGSTCSGCSITGTVSADTNVGGLIGLSENGSIELCRAECAIEGTENVGGMAGFSQESVFDQCFTLGDIQGFRNAGGLAGYLYKTHITNCYSRASVSGNWYTGGLAGYNHTGSIKISYAAGPVSGSAFAGGLLAFNESGILEASYWDVEATKQDTSPASEMTAGKTTGEMQLPETFEGWDFVQVWDIRPGASYPYLRKIPE